MSEIRTVYNVTEGHNFDPRQVSAGASFQCTIAGAASKRSVITIVARHKDVLLTYAKVFAGSPAVFECNGAIQHGLINQSHVLGLPITESESEVTGLNIVPGFSSVTGIPRPAFGNPVVQYQAYVGRRGDSAVGLGFISTAVTRADDTPDFLLHEASGGFLRIPTGCMYFFACTTTNLAIRGDFKGYEIFDSKQMVSLP